MQEPSNSGECDYMLCAMLDYESGEYDSAKDPGPLMRCSVCKNRFYCSARCQKKDWKEHKWNCSVFPSAEGLPAATIVEIDDEFKAEVKRVAAVLKEVADALKGENKKISAPMLAPLLKITSELPDRLRYTRAVQDSDEFKYRLPIVTACRLLLIDYIYAIDEADLRRYEKWFSTMQFPMDFCELYGPKIVARPADLSPGEYAMIPQLMPVWTITEMEKSKAERKKQVEEQSAEEDAGEEAERMQWISLAVVSKKAYSAKSTPSIHGTASSSASL